VYTGTRRAQDSLSDAIIAILNGKIPVTGDILVVNNSENGRDAFVYSDAHNDWIHIGSTLSDSLSANVTALEGRVGNLEVLLNGIEANPEQGVEG